MSEATDSVTSLAVRAHEILTGCVDGYMRRYDVRMGEMVSDCLLHPITCVRFTHDGNCLLATCMDDTVRLFDKSNGELLNSYSGHKNSSYKVECAMTRERKRTHERTHETPTHPHTHTHTHTHTLARARSLS
jgi:mitogen-activated protein kinase organizer 1